MKLHRKTALGLSATLLLGAIISVSGSVVQAEGDHHVTVTVDQVE